MRGQRGEKKKREGKGEKFCQNLILSGGGEDILSPNLYGTHLGEKVLILNFQLYSFNNVGRIC